MIENRPIDQLLSIVKNDFRKFDQEGLIDDALFIKTVMYCNEKLGIPIKGIKEIAIAVDDFQAELPLDFDKLYYVAALDCSNTRMTYQRNPFDNNIDTDAVYKAVSDVGTIGCVENCKVVIERKGTPVTYYHNQWTQLDIAQNSFGSCHIDCPNKRKPGKYQVEIKDGKIHTPFRTGTLYIIYIGLMQDDDGNILFPFHPLITPYYEWSIKEKIISDAIFNSDGADLGNMYKLAQSERVKAYLDAFNFTIDDKSYGRYKEHQRQRELGWYSKWFRYFQ